MTEVEIAHLLAELSKTAKALNKESDSLNELIEQLEEKLNAMNVGLEVWLTNDELASTKYEEDTGREYQGEPVMLKVTYDTQLGYAKIGDSWHLAVREMKYAYEWDDRGNVQDWEEVDVTERPTRLLDSSRKIRLAALAMFPLLLKALHRETQAAVAAIEAAQKLVK